MTASILQEARTARRTVKALGIVERQSCELQDDGRWIVCDVVTGSGTPRTVVHGHCDCPDHTRRAAYCKHLQAVALEEQALAIFCDDWNTRSEQQRQSVSETFQQQNLPAKSQQGPRCPDCGAPLVSQSYHIGGKGLVCFLVCTRDLEHRAVQA
jgi:hypothetical protein